VQKELSSEQLQKDQDITRRNLKINNWIYDSFIIVMDTCD
jgi:hypothetical protein